MNTYKLTQDERFALVMECRWSGMTDHQWCEEHGISTNTMYRWIRKFRHDVFPYVPVACKSSAAVRCNTSESRRLAMIGGISIADNIYIITGYTDMRRSIDGLYAIVMDKLNNEPDACSIYMFCGKRCDRIKILLREKDGYFAY